jgi:hypothetical protein
MNHGDAKSLLPRDETACQHSPGSLRVANSLPTRVSVDSLGKFNAAVQNLRRKRLGEKYSAGVAVSLATRAVNDQRPVLQKDQSPPAFAVDFTGISNWRVVFSRATLVNNFESSFESDKIAPTFASLPGYMNERFGPAARPGHQFDAARWRVADPAWHIEADNLELRTGIERRSEGAERLGDGA